MKIYLIDGTAYINRYSDSKFDNIEFNSKLLIKSPE